jgi:hypothetical protein
MRRDSRSAAAHQTLIGKQQQRVKDLTGVLPVVPACREQPSAATPLQIHWAPPAWHATSRLTAGLYCTWAGCPLVSLLGIVPNLVHLQLQHASRHRNESQSLGLVGQSSHSEQASRLRHTTSHQRQDTTHTTEQLGHDACAASWRELHGGALTLSATVSKASCALLPTLCAASEALSSRPPVLSLTQSPASSPPSFASLAACFASCFASFAC